MEKIELSFEQALSELEKVVAKLEEGNSSLEKTIALYQRGRALAEYCQQLLDHASLQVQQLSADGSVHPLGG